MPDRVDVAIIGGGIVGLATAHLLLEAKPGLKVAVLEKEVELATHQSGHNSGVIHAGIYYAPGSLKATLCREGKAKLERFAGDHGIAFRHPGKLVVALSDDEGPRLEALCERAAANGVEGLEILGRERIHELEPHVAGARALWSPTTGIIDFREVALAYAEEARARGADIHVDRVVTSIEERGDGVVLGTSRGELEAANVVACAGLQADRVSAMTGERGPDVPRIVPFRGDYYTLTPDARHLVSRLIYPLPDPRFPFLGVHFTPRIDGEVWAGPNAVLAFAREEPGVDVTRSEDPPADWLGGHRVSCCVGQAQARSKRSMAVSTRTRPIASEAVAAGDGALRTWRTRREPPRLKSSTS